MAKKTNKIQTLIALLTSGTAYPDTITWLTENQELTLAQLWQRCPRSDWMLWIAAKLDIDRKQLVLAACDCVESVLHHVPEGETRPAKAIEVARAWTRDKATLAEVRQAAGAANAYCAVAANVAETYVATAANAAATGADAAVPAAVANIAAANAAVAGAAGIDDDYDADDVDAVHKRNTRLVRKHITWRDIDAVL